MNSLLSYLKSQAVNYLTPDIVIIAVIITSIVVVVWLVLGLLLERIPHRRMLRVSRKTKDKKKYYPAVIGAMVGFFVVGQYTVWAIVGVVVGGIAGQVCRVFYMWVVNKITEDKKAGEVILLYEIVSAYTSAGYSLYEALSAGVYLVNLIEKPLKRCLDRWGQGPQRALERLGDELKGQEAKTLVKLLQRAVIVGPEKMKEFLSRESMVMERLRRYRAERSLGVRPIIQTLYLVFPGMALLGVTLMPIGYHIIQAIMSIRLS